jgi:hypothetical protein
MTMRVFVILLALALLVACAPPHPTHPTKVECFVNIETNFSARIDNSPQVTDGGIRSTNDPCQSQGGFVTNFSTWTQRDTSTVPICVAAGTTNEQAASLCSRYFETSGRSVATARPPAARPPFGGRICPGSVNVESTRIVGMGGVASLNANQCLEGTTWPLVP